MDWVGVAYVNLLLLTIFLGTVMLVYTAHRRGVPGGRPLTGIFILLISWSIAVLGELNAPNLGGKLFFFNLRLIGLVALPVFWLLLSYEVYRQDYWRRWRLLAAILVFPAITLILGFINHPIIREGFGTASRFGLTVVVTRRGPWVTLETAYSYTLILLGVILLLDLLRRTVPGQRHQTISLIVGINLAVLGNLFDLIRINPVAPLGPMVLMFVPAGLCLMWGLFRQRLLDVLPVAHDRVLEAISDGVMVVNAIGKVVDLNRAARDTFARILPAKSDLLGMPVTEALAGWPEWQARTPETRTRFEVTHHSGFGRLTFEVEVSSLHTPRGELMGQVMLINDITTQKRALELSAERERILVLQRFMRDASHDLRTPMSVINSSAYIMKRLADRQIEVLATLHPKLPQVYAAVIEEAIDMTGKLRDRAVAADDAAKRLWSILSGMLEMAELEAADYLEKSEMDFNLIVEAVVKARKSESERHGVEVSITLDPALPQIIADEKRLSRAMDAVVLNALQYTPEGGRASVRTELAGSYVCLEVTDTGMGISADDLPHIYERFFRADRARSTETGGAGLGLSLAKAIIEAHDGKMSVTSELGVGTTFKLYVPIGMPS